MASLKNFEHYLASRWNEHSCMVVWTIFGIALSKMADKSTSTKPWSAKAMKNVLKQPEKNAQRGPGEKGWACYYCGKEGHLKRDCPQASKPPPAPRTVCKGPHWKRYCPQRRRSPGSDSQDNQDWRCLGVPTQAPVLITPEEPWVLIVVGGQSVDFLLDTGATYSVLTEAPWPTYFLIRFCNGTVWTSQNVLLQCFCQLWLGFGAIFTQVSDCARASLTPFGEGYTEQGPCLCFHEYRAFPFSPFNWTKCKS